MPTINTIPYLVHKAQAEQDNYNRALQLTLQQDEMAQRNEQQMFNDEMQIQNAQLQAQQLREDRAMRQRALVTDESRYRDTLADRAKDYGMRERVFNQNAEIAKRREEDVDAKFKYDELKTLVKNTINGIRHGTVSPNALEGIIKPMSEADQALARSESTAAQRELLREYTMADNAAKNINRFDRLSELSGRQKELKYDELPAIFKDITGKDYPADAMTAWRGKEKLRRKMLDEYLTAQTGGANLKDVENFKTGADYAGLLTKSPAGNWKSLVDRPNSLEPTQGDMDALMRDDYRGVTGPTANAKVAVISPSGVRGTIPVSQLGTALKQGYRQSP